MKKRIFVAKELSKFFIFLILMWHILHFLLMPDIEPYVAAIIIEAIQHSG